VRPNGFDLAPWLTIPRERTFAMFKAKKESGWTFNTSSGVSLGVSIGFVGGTGGAGTLVFNSPDGAIVEFHYMSLGPSVGIGESFNLSGSTRDFRSGGAIYLSSTFSGSELSIQDFAGYTLSQEASASVGGGGAVTVMLLGISGKHMPMEILRNTGALGIAAQIAVDHPNITRVLAGPIGGFLFDKTRDNLSNILQDDAKAAVIMGGLNAGYQLGAGVSQSIGVIWDGKVTQRAPVPPPGPWKLTVTPIPPDHEVLHLPGDVLFAFDKADLKPRANVKPHAEDVLWEAAYYIQKKSPSRIRIEGHTDGIGKAEYNMGLSVRRAEAVRQWLIARKIVTPSNTEIKGWGMSKPAAPNFKSNRSDDPVGRAKNRRVEIWLTT
jgi:outer membrane protein OmpA-like peptidoglycan-associated protein